jgi:hypothetical protein
MTGLQSSTTPRSSLDSATRGSFDSTRRLSSSSTTLRALARPQSPSTPESYTPRPPHAPYLPQTEENSTTPGTLDALQSAIAAEKHRQGKTLTVRVWRMWFSRARF